MLAGHEALMATYAVGDIQGCYKPLQLLLKQVQFDPDRDVLWCCGDLVNRGPESLTTLRFLKGLGEACVCVLGNHDLQLLAYAAGGKSFKGDTLEHILAADDCDELIDWLRFRPLLHHDEALNWCMVHAGISPLWSLQKAKKRALKIEYILQSELWAEYCILLQDKDFPAQDSQDKAERNLFATAVFTRTRFCTAHGAFDWHHKTAHMVESDAGSHLQRKEVAQPWFEHMHAKWKQDCRVVFGHWAAKGLVRDQQYVFGLDTGCVWGGALTLARLDISRDVQLFSQTCASCERE